MKINNLSFILNPPLSEPVGDQATGQNLQPSPPPPAADAEGKGKRHFNSDLEVLADMAEAHSAKRHKMANPYVRCFRLISSLDRATSSNPLDLYFEKLLGCNMWPEEEQRCVNLLQDFFSKEQIVTIVEILDWYHLIIYGFLHQESGYFESLEDVKQFLGISECIQILNPNTPLSAFDLDNMSFERLMTLLINAPNTPQRQNGEEKNHFEEFLEAARAALSNEKTGEFILYSIDDYFEDIQRQFDTGKFSLPSNAKSIIENMDYSFKMRFAAFLTVAIVQLSDSDANEGVIQTPGKWPHFIKKELIPLLEVIDQASFILRNSPEENELQNKPPVQDLSVGRKEKYVFCRALKAENPAFPNWMPNGGNSCYLSTVLWDLFVLLGEEIRGRIEHFKDREQLKNLFPHSTQDETRAREEFYKLYNKIASVDAEEIGTEDVNAFRVAVKKAYPERFVSQDPFSQEDASEFLVTLLDDLLALEIFGRQASKFQFLHKFEKKGDEPLVDEKHYNYPEALAPSYQMEPSSVLDIRLSEGTQHPCRLSDLAAAVRKTEEVERNAYKEGEHEGPNYRSVLASHTEQLIVGSKESAPKYFICRLTRFFQDPAEGVEKKRLDLICPNASLDFHIRGQEEEEETVSYDLSAIAVHSGKTIHSGHYYTYIRQRLGQEWRFVKYCDINGPDLSLDAKSVMQDASRNGYIFYYKKREGRDLPPPLLPFEENFEELAPQEAISEGEVRLPLSAEMDVEEAPSFFDSVPMLPKEEIDKIIEKNTPFLDTPASPPNQQEELGSNSLEATQWLRKNPSINFVMEGYFHSVGDYAKYFGEDPASEGRALNSISSLLTCPIYMIDPTGDPELCVLDGNYPIPGDRFRYGEEFVESNPLYLFRQSDGSVVAFLKSTH